MSSKNAKTTAEFLSPYSHIEHIAEILCALCNYMVKLNIADFVLNLLLRQPPHFELEQPLRQGSLQVIPWTSVAVAVAVAVAMNEQ